MLLLDKITQKTVPDSFFNVAELFARLDNGEKIPLYDSKVQAGFPSPALDFIQDMLSADDFLVRNKTATFFCRVAGDSMNQSGIEPGDILVIDRSFPAVRGRIVIAEMLGRFTVKTLGDNSLIPSNPSYPTIYFREEMQVNYVGTVTGMMRRFL